MTDILLVEDNAEISGLLKAFLERDGFSVCPAVSGEAALEFLQDHTVKILILDIMLPGMDGFAVCRAIRQRQNMPVLIMSARSGREDKLIGYELGADDYMEKPVDPEILAAKVRALIARAYGITQEQSIITSGALSIDTDSRKVYLSGNPMELNVKEYDLLLLFAKNPGKTLTKAFLFGQIWGMDSFSEEQTLTVHVKMLRSKIEENPKTPRRIVTVWGVGYRYEEI